MTKGIDMLPDEVGPIMIVVSRSEVENGDTSQVLSALRKLISTPDLVRQCRERVVIAFDGYNECGEELFEIPAVRNFVYALDQHFPFWLYFLSRYSSSLQFISLCFLPPFLTEEARQKIYPERLKDLLEQRWGPALDHVCDFIGLPESKREELRNSAIKYFLQGPMPIG